MNDKDYSNLGNQIKNLVSDAVGNMNYDELNKNISATVNRALEEARKGLQKGAEAAKNASAFSASGNNQNTGNPGGPNTGQNVGNGRTANQGNMTYNRQQSRTVSTQWTTTRTQNPTTAVGFPVNVQPVGKTKSVLLMGFGGAIGGTFLLVAVGTAIFGSIVSGITGEGFLGVGISTGILSVLSAGFWGMFAAGQKINARRKRLMKYLAVFGERKYCEIKELAQKTTLNSKIVTKDFEKLISQGVFPDGHLNRDNTYFMGDTETYRQYMETAANVQKLEAQKQAQIEAELHMDAKTREVRDAVAKGRAFVADIRSANDRILGEEISRKLDTLELVTDKIFDRVNEKPEQFPEIRKFMDYYLPTTQKLVKAYEEFDSQPIQADNILKSKAEIEKTIDTINMAFGNLYNSLFEDEAMDVSSDISVLHTMFAQEGLTNPDFVKNNQKNNL
ncbi:MAG: 5-bromo-4-chloroindolyl phosphate hydrolysis family protein [Lachnospiraceae bacterium]|nr:5-bromo-4-chloroindolyl phosphate hydrolysis family protein [Lachnospiraceae bacterium]MDD3616295.1 5-bromo-4-chloroindolyl phosphate hydrolysis family protein [Lachnospiraceae bacterium]